MKFSLILSGAILWSISSFAATDEVKKLDYRQAELNETKSRVNQIATEHGKYKLLRDREIYGSDGRIAEIKTWYLSINRWFNAWAPILNGMNQATFRDQLATKQLVARIQLQLDLLHELEFQREVALQRLDESQAKAKNLVRYAPKYLKNFDQQISVLNRNFDRLEQDVVDTRAKYQNESLSLHKEVCEKVIKLVENKAFLEATDFSTLKNLVDQIRFSLDSFELIEKYRVEISREALAIRELYLDKGQPLTALQRYAVLESKLPAFKAQVDKQVQFHQAFRESIIKSMEFAVKSLKGELDLQEADDPATDKFKRKYEEEVYTFGSSIGFAERCKNLDRTLNCDIMREILFFPVEKLEKLDKDQLLYLEQQLEKVKRGPVL